MRSPLSHDDLLQAVQQAMKEWEDSMPNDSWVGTS